MLTSAEKASDILSKFESAMHTSFANYLATGKDVHWHDPSKGVPETPAECEAASAPLVNVNLYDGPELPERLTDNICSALAAADAQTALSDFQSKGMSLSSRIKEGLGLSSGGQQRSWFQTRNKLARDLERDSTLNILAAKGKKGGAGQSFGERTTLHGTAGLGSSPQIRCPIGTEGSTRCVGSTSRRRWKTRRSASCTAVPMVPLRTASK